MCVCVCVCVCMHCLLAKDRERGRERESERRSFRGVLITVVENGYDGASSFLGRNCLHFTYR